MPVAFSSCQKLQILSPPLRFCGHQRLLFEVSRQTVRWQTKMSARTNMSNTCSVVSENGRNPSLNRFPMLRSNKSPFVFLGTNNPSDARATGLKWTYRQRGSTWKRVLGYEKPAKTINFSGFIYLDCQFPRPFLLRC